MKKTAIISVILASQLVLAKSNYRAQLKTEADLFVNNGSYIGMTYRPLELKISDRASKYEFGLKVRGQRGDITQKDTVFLFENREIEDLLEIPSEYTTHIEGSPYTEEYDIIGGLGKGHYHSPHEHENATHSHSIFEDEDEHEHKHDSNILEIENPRWLKPVTKNTDIQLKLWAKYRPVKLTTLKLSYMPFTYDGDERRYNNSLLAEAEYIKVFNDKYSISLRPKYTTEKFIKPLLAELTTDFKYKIDKDTTFKASMYNALQFKVFSEKRNFRNALELTYDYSKEARQFHKFYENLDHEHEKIDQTKVSLKLAHNGSYLLNPIKNANLKYDEKNDIFTTELNFVYKKSDFLTEGLTFENNLEVKNEINKNTTNNRKYEVNSKLYLTEEDPNVRDKIRDIMTNGYVSSKIRHQNEDKSKYEDYFFYELNGKKYLIVESGVSDNPTTYTSKVLYNNLNIDNKTKISYNDFEISNDFELETDFKGNKVVVYNRIKASYENKIAKFTIKPHVEHLYAPLFVKGEGVPIVYNIFKLGADINYFRNFEDLKIKVGVKSEAGMQLRKAKDGYVADDNVAEANKWVIGWQLAITPYIKSEYNINDNASVFMTAKAPFIFSKSAISSNRNKFNAVEDKFSFKRYSAEIKLGLKYTW